MSFFLLLLQPLLLLAVVTNLSQGDRPTKMVTEVLSKVSTKATEVCRRRGQGRTGNDSAGGSMGGAAIRCEQPEMEILNLQSLPAGLLSVGLSLCSQALHVV